MTNHWFIPKQQQVEIVDALNEVPDIVADLVAASCSTLRVANWNPKVSTGENVQPLPYNVTAVDAQDRLLICLEAWVYWLADARNMQITENTVVGYAEWLQRNILLLAATEGSQSAHHAITTETRHARRATNTRPAKPVIHAVDVAQARNRLLNANGCATLAKEIGVEGLTRVRINTLHLNGHIEPVQRVGRTLIYRVGDVLDAHETVITWKPKKEKKTA
ncbi:hypothetical protein B2J88_07995 [Rhodococcus sp. SRB_17]|nr:hypothetical protein [Rhodococcus sp. SRB_17]